MWFREVRGSLLACDAAPRLRAVPGLSAKAFVLRDDLLLVSYRPLAVSDVVVPKVLAEPPTASASEEPIMSTASTASVGLLTSSRQQPLRGDDIGSLCRNASPSRKGAFSSSVVVSANAQHARFIATTIYRTCGIVVTSARLTTHSSGPSSFYPTLGVCLGPNRPRRCRRGGRSSIIGDAWISEGRRSVAASHSRVSRSMACGDGCGPGDACADGLATPSSRLMAASGTWRGAIAGPATTPDS